MLWSCCAAAQKTDVTVITSSNETFTGKVDDREWLSNPSLIRIKKDGSTSFTEYFPEQLKSVRIKDGDYYESYLVKIDMTPSEFEGPSLDSTEIASTEKHAFLLVQLTTPEFSLYSYRAKNQLRYYFKKGNETPQELIHRKYTVRKNNGIFELEDNDYISQLEFLSKNCEAADKKLNSLSYTLEGLTDLITTYYKTCAGSDIVYRRTQPGKGKFSASILAGGSQTTLAFVIKMPEAVYFGAVTRKPLTNKGSFSPGIRLHYIVPRAHEKLSLAFELYHNNFTTSAFEYTYNTAPQDYQTKQVDIDANYLHSTLGIKYSLNKESRIRPFISGGAVQSFIVSYKAKVVFDKHYYAPGVITTQDPFLLGSLKKSSLGFFFGGGLTYNRIGFDLRYHIVGNLGRSTTLSASMNAATMFLSYRFTR